ncbi:hypothetical protein XFFB_02065 [Xylella fastidiosa]|nr:hypothetical protein XFFB_02065 [Xylella fastidiosa]
MAQNSDFIKAVDAFMQAPKILHGTSKPVWESARNIYAARMKLPIEVAGELHGPHINIDAYPDHRPRKFTIGILFADRFVCRLDYDPGATHSNKWRSGLPPFVKGPHWHSWELNRKEFIKPDPHFPRLPYAIGFTKARHFDSCLRWYCQARNIHLGAHEIEFPYSGLLI